MEYRRRQNPMRNSRLPLFLMALAALLRPALAQQAGHFYNIDKEIKIEGTIQEIRLEPRYEKTAPFLIILLQQKNTGQKFMVEVSPAWFFSQDFHKGEAMKVVGSVYTKGDGPQNVIAREIQYLGKTYAVRDKQGFPNWRGGPGGLQKRRRGKGA